MHGRTQGEAERGKSARPEREEKRAVGRHARTVAPDEPLRRCAEPVPEQTGNREEDRSEPNRRCGSAAGTGRTPPRSRLGSRSQAPRDPGLTVTTRKQQEIRLEKEGTDGGRPDQRPNRPRSETPKKRAARLTPAQPAKNPTARNDRFCPVFRTSDLELTGRHPIYHAYRSQ